MKKIIGVLQSTNYGIAILAALVALITFLLSSKYRLEAVETKATNLDTRVGKIECLMNNNAIDHAIITNMLQTIIKRIDKLP